MTAHDLPLGRQVEYPREYDASLLFPIARANGRREIGLEDSALPFIGSDRWHAYELGWLDMRGRPRTATATFTVPAESPNLIESKSLKLYLNSFNATRFDGAEPVRAAMERDLSKTAGAPVAVAFGVPTVDRGVPAASIDEADVDIDHYGPPRAQYLSAGTAVVEETLSSAALKSNCPVTGQPDWARVSIHYRGPQIDRAGLLRYFVSFRDHCEFHEQCVERIFKDLLEHAKPQALSVEARYTRRGGLDINPWRATPGFAMPLPGRDERQ